MINKTKKSVKRGFTLIELMIVVAIIGILAAVAIPKFADLIAKSKEGATRGSLGSVRSALAVYYGDWEGYYPVDNDQDGATKGTDELNCMIPKYLKEIPTAKIPKSKDHSNPGHPDSSYVYGASTANYINPTAPALGDKGGWSYADQEHEPDWGNFLVNCTHLDSTTSREFPNGKYWTLW